MGTVLCFYVLRKWGGGARYSDHYTIFSEDEA